MSALNEVVSAATAGLEDLQISGTEEVHFAADGRIEALIDIYRPDLSTIVSKWIGKLEKTEGADG